MPMQITLSDREADLMLCGLRMLQGYVIVGGPADEPVDADFIEGVSAAYEGVIRSEGGDDPTSEEIDTLCEKVNLGHESIIRIAIEVEGGIVTTVLANVEMNVRVYDKDDADSDPENYEEEPKEEDYPIEVY